MQQGLNGEMDLDTLAARAKAARTFAKMTQEQAETASGVKQSDISKIERGETERPASLRAGQLVTVYLRPGPHIIGARPNGICGGGDAEVEITVREGRSNSVRVGSDQSGSLRIQPTAF